jgi:long-chain acyl-CoA synthetase
MEVGVAGIPDPHKGEAAKGWVVLKEGCTVTESQLRDFCRERLSAYKVPVAIEFRPTLPKTLVGKILRRELAAQHREKESA